MPASVRLVGTTTAAELAAELAGGTTLLVTDPGVSAAGVVERVTAALGTPVGEIMLAPGEPTVSSVDAAAAVMRAARPDAVIAVGGGSVMDTAKLATCIVPTDESVTSIVGGPRPHDRRSPLIAVPTTAGSGAEVTRTAVVTDEHGHKSWAWGAELRPDIAYHDPELTLGCPHRLTMACGLDALVHAIEAATTPRTTDTEHSTSALRLIREALPAVVADPSDLAGRAAMQHGATHAGLAIDAFSTGLGHNIGHALGTVHGVQHGFAVALGLLATAAWSAEPEPERYATVAAALGTTPHDLPDWLMEFVTGLGFAAAGAEALPAQIDATALAAAMASAENRPMRENNARVASLDDLPELAEMTAATWQRMLAR